MNKFYEFNQNNSGGSFSVDNNVTHRVLIEASSYEEALYLAESIGIYFDGCEEELDCPCCGDRWYRPDEAKEFPLSYGSFKKNEAESNADKYGAILEKSNKKHLYGYGENWDIVFSTPESYMQYLADNYGWTEPDGYIYYKSGKKVEISKGK